MSVPAALFLTMALALSPVSFNGESKVDTIRRLRDFIQSRYPGAEMVITPHDQPPPSLEWEKVPLTWGGMEIWVKRRPVHDRHRTAIAA